MKLSYNDEFTGYEQEKNLKNLDYLEELVNSIICLPNAFRINFQGSDKYIFSINTTNKAVEKYYEVSALYDSVIDLDTKIKYSFFKAKELDLPETLKNFNTFNKPNEIERIALYFIENMLYRISILWDTLAQLCNIVFDSNIAFDKINYSRYFNEHSKGTKKFGLAKEINDYLNENDDTNNDDEPWKGNHVYLKEYRNQMTHRIAPGVTTLSNFGFSMRPPEMYLLHRTTEDYYQVSAFLCRIINDFLEKHIDRLPFKSDTTEIKN